MISGISLILGPRARMWDPYVYVTCSAPTVVDSKYGPLLSALTCFFFAWAGFVLRKYVYVMGTEGFQIRGPQWWPMVSIEGIDSNECPIGP